jgi:flagellar biosynthetic protein FlhB
MAEGADQNDSDRSQEPTQKRIEEAIKRGDVVKSQEVSTWFVIAAATLMVQGYLQGR